jgi:hypothetical protein
MYDWWKRNREMFPAAETAEMSPSMTAALEQLSRVA